MQQFLISVVFKKLIEESNREGLEIRDKKQREREKEKRIVSFN